MIKSGQAWAGSFVTLDATGALAAGTPSGVLYVDGVANGATVTITGSNPYKFSVTLPSHSQQGKGWICISQPRLTR